MRRGLLALVMTVAMSVVALAADVTGKWVGSVEGPNGPIELTYEFKADGEALTGSVSSAMGTQEISNGKVAGDVLSYEVNLEGGKITHTAKVSAAGDEITITATGDWGSVEYVVKKAAAQ
jgi:hypothetical protein